MPDNLELPVRKVLDWIVINNEYGHLLVLHGPEIGAFESLDDGKRTGIMLRGKYIESNTPFAEVFSMVTGAPAAFLEG